jgi:hypothetical protein
MATWLSVKQLQSTTHASTSSAWTWRNGDIVLLFINTTKDFSKTLGELLFFNQKKIIELE